MQAMHLLKKDSLLSNVIIIFSHKAQKDQGIDLQLSFCCSCPFHVIVEALRVIPMSWKRIFYSVFIFATSGRSGSRFDF